MNAKQLHEQVKGHVVFPNDLCNLFKYAEAARENVSLDTPLFCLKFNLPLPSGKWPVVLEGFDDGSWAVYFEDNQSIIAGSNDNWKEALCDLVINATDELQVIREYGDNSTPHLKNRRKFLEKVFDYDA